MRISINLLFLIGFSAAAGLAQQPAEGPVTNYTGYAHLDCGPANSPGFRIVLPAGAVPVPETVPKSPPRPAVELVISAPVDRAVGQQMPFVRDAASGAGLSVVGLSCPVIGSCSRAQSGTLTVQRRPADGALTGEFRARWPDEPARATVVIGRFIAVWREAATKCS
jgi:hypothetical protein